MKLIKKNRKTIHAQGVLEYILVVGIVVVALLAMTQVIKRGSQSLIRMTAAQIGAQNTADQSFSNTTGFLENQRSTASSDSQKQVIDRGGIINYVQDELTDVNSNSVTNMGFTEDQ